MGGSTNDSEPAESDLASEANDHGSGREASASLAALAVVNDQELKA